MKFRFTIKSANKATRSVLLGFSVLALSGACANPLFTGLTSDQAPQVLASGAADELPLPTPHSQSAQDQSASASNKQANSETPTTRSFSPDTMYSLLVAEFAIKRDRLDIALGNYVQQAHLSKDPAVIERAINIASYMNAKQETLGLATLWQQADPENPRAHAIAADQLTYFNRRLMAIDAAEKVLALGADYSFALFIQSLESVPADNYITLTKALLDLSASYPKNAEIWTAISRTQELSGDRKAALDASKKAVNLDDTYALATIMRGQQLYFYGEDSKKVLSYLRKAIDRVPGNKALHILYLQTLIALDEKEKSIAHMDLMLSSSADDRDLKFDIALIAWENEMDGIAKVFFVQLLEESYRKEDVHYYLGRIALSDKNYDTAMDHFEKISLGGNLYLTARLHIAQTQKEMGDFNQARTTLIESRQFQPRDAATFYHAESELLLDQDQSEEAMLVLDKGLREHPSSTNLLYARAMLGEQLGNLNILEQDLIKIIELEPNNSTALNALGFTLTDRTDRHVEALRYITKAFQISPTDPAVVDSLGWVNYRLGNHSEALKHLRQANEMQYDHEIAAHLGEVLWVAGEKEEAMKVWKDAQKKTKNSSILKAVMEKFIK